MDDFALQKLLLTDFVNELTLVSGEDFANIGIGGNYSVKQEDVSKEVIAFVLCYLEQRKFPPKLTLFLAKKLAELLTNDQEKDTDVEDCPFPSAGTLHVVALDRLHKLCHQMLDHGEVVDTSIVSSDELPYVSVSAIKNKRRKMEDRHVVIHDLNSLFDLKDCPSHSYYAVFDGHGGIDAASFAATHLHANIIQHPEFLSNTTKAISEAYKLTDIQFCQRVSGEGTKSGCTAVTALIRNDTLYLAWLGDSQALLVKQGKPIKLVAPHTPDRQDERARIEELGGFVCHLGTWRVNGTLAVSRALGDQDFKPFIISEPEVSEIHLDGTEDFLILACDGLWDGITPEETSSTLYRSLCDVSGDECDSIAKKLVDKSKQQGSDDNITAVVIFLRKASDISPDAVKYVLSEIELNAHENPKGHQTLHQNASSAGSLDELLKMQNHVPERPTSLYNVVSSFPSLKHDSDLPPEATILSELPTPPIDDILKEQIPLCEQSKLTVHGDTHEQRQQTAAESPKTETPLLVQLADEKMQPASAPDQAFQVAASIVSGVVEAAIAHIDNTGMYDSSVASGVDLMSDDVLVNPVHPDVSVATKEMDNLTEIPDSNLNGFECSEVQVTSSMTNPEPPMIPRREIACFDQEAAKPAGKSLAIPQEENTECFDQDSAESLAKPASIFQEENSKCLDQDSVDSSAEPTALTQGESVSCTDVTLESETKSETASLEESDRHYIESLDKPLAVSQQEDSKDIGQDSGRSITESFESGLIKNNEVEMQSVFSSVLLPEVNGANNVASVQQEDIDTRVENMELQQSSLVDTALDSLAAHLPSPSNQELPTNSVEPALDKETFLSNDTVDSMELFNQKKINSSCDQNLSEESSKETVLADDMQAATVAIDLKSVPEFIPEAEGVVEDFDSDSEKDGGWSFIKPPSSDSSELVVPNLKSPEKGKEPSKSTPSTTKEKLKVPKPIQNTISQSKSPVQSPRKQVITKTLKSKTLSKTSDEKQSTKVTGSAVSKSLTSPTVPSSRIAVTEDGKGKTPITTARVLPKGSVRTPGSKVAQQVPRPSSAAQKPSLPRAGMPSTQKNKEKASVLPNKPDSSTVKKSNQSQTINASRLSSLKAATAKVTPAQGVIKPQRNVPSSVAHNVKETKNNVNKLIVTETLAARTQPPKRTGIAAATPKVNASVKDKPTSQKPKPVAPISTSKVIGDGIVRAPPLKTGIATRNLRKVAPKDEVKKDSHLSDPKTKKESMSAIKALGNKRDLKKKTDSSVNTKISVQGKSQPTESNSEKPNESASNVP